MEDQEAPAPREDEDLLEDIVGEAPPAGEYRLSTRRSGPDVSGAP